MKRKRLIVMFLIVVVLITLVSFLFFNRSRREEIPLLTISNNNQKMIVQSGSVVWNNMDGAPREDWDRGGLQKESFFVSSGAYIQLSFDYKPKDYSVYLKNEDNSYTEISVEENGFYLETTEESIIYLISGYWREGEAHYIIRFDVN